ncbi:unnamed protein product [Urochloa humidicola]
MVPCAPEEHPIAGSSTMRPLPVRRRGGGGYGLVVLATRQVPPPEEEGEEGFATLEEVLCVWTPAAAEEEEPPWRVHRRRYPAEADEHPFSAELMFAFDDKAFFVDLSQGLVYCDRPAAAADNSVVEFRFVPLPESIPVDLKWNKTKTEDMGALYPDRTMRRVAGAIRFVCIDRTRTRRRRRYGDATVTLWTLNIGADKEWSKDMEFQARDLWRMKGFQEARLPRMEAKCPFLMPDGTLCLLLPNKRRRMEDSPDDHICCIDLNSMSILWSGRLRGYCFDEPAMLPSGFFKKLLRPLVPIKGELSSICVEDEDY